MAQTSISNDNISRSELLWRNLYSKGYTKSPLADFAGHLKTTVTVPAKTYPPTNVLVTGSGNNYTDFEIPYNPGFETDGNWNIFLCLKTLNTDVSNTVTMGFGEGALDRTSGVQW